MRKLKQIACTLGAMLGIILGIGVFFGIIIGIVFLCEKIHTPKIVSTIGGLGFALAAFLAIIFGAIKWYKDTSWEVQKWLAKREYQRSQFDFKKGDHIQQKYYDQMRQPVLGQIWVVRKANPYRGWVQVMRGQELTKIYWPKDHDYKVVYRPSDHKTAAS